jgi:hypothetical protein
MVCTGRKEREKERESARGRGKEEERKTSAKAIGGASTATAAFFQGAFHLFFLEFYFLDLHLLAFILAFICQRFQFSWVMASFPSFHPPSLQVFKFFYFLCSHFIHCRG